MSFEFKKSLLTFAIGALALTGCGENSKSENSQKENNQNESTTSTTEEETQVDQVTTDSLPLVGAEDPNAKVVFEVVDGKAVVEGDIILGDYDELLAAGQVKAFDYPEEYNASTELNIANDNNEESAQRSAWGGHRKWVNGIVPYVVRNGDFTSSDLNVMKQAMAEIEAAAKIKFVPAQQGSNHIEIYRGNGCSSAVGMNGGKQFLSLGYGCVYKGIVIHEFMHALGFYHEQSRADRDDYVTIHWGNIQGNMAYNFNKLGAVTTSLGPYDYDSIMHYESYAFSYNGYDTISSKKPGVSFGQRKGLSALDKEALRKTYGAPIDTTTGTTNQAPRVKMKYSAIWMWNNSTYNMPFEFYDDQDSIDSVEVTYQLDRQGVIVQRSYPFIKDQYNKSLFYIPLETLDPYNVGKGYSKVTMTFTFKDSQGAKTVVELPIYVYTYANWRY